MPHLRSVIAGLGRGLGHALLAACIFLAAGIGTASSSRAYEFEHYAWTYYIALQMGFTERQAFQLASVAFAIDWHDNTGPMPHGLVEEIEAAAGGASEENMRSKWRKFHAFARQETIVDGLAAGKSEAEVAADVKAEKDREAEHLWQIGIWQQNVGAHIHFIQDIYSHDGWADMFGHGSASHVPDFLAWDPAMARNATAATVAALARFRAEVCAEHDKDYCDDPFRANPDIAEFQPVLDRLLAENPLPVDIGKPQQLMDALKRFSLIFERVPLKYGSNLFQIAIGMEAFMHLGEVTRNGEHVNALAWLKFMPSPDFDVAHRIIVDSIRAQKAAANPAVRIRGFSYPGNAAMFPSFSPDLPRDWLQYSFGVNGELVGDAASYMVEDIIVRIEDESIEVERIGDDDDGVFRATAKFKLALDGMAPINFIPRLPMVVESKPGGGAPPRLDTAWLDRDTVFEFEHTQEWRIKDVAGDTFTWDVDLDIYSLPAKQRSFELDFGDGDLAAACNSAVDSGGDEGGGVTVDLGGFVGKAGFTWQMYDIKDQMNVSIGGVERTTGCVSGGGTFELDIQPGMSQAVVEVLPNCEQTTGTAWVFEFECPLTSEVTADGTGRVLPGDDDDAGSGGAPGSGGQIGQGSVGGGLSGMPPVTTGAGAPPGPFGGASGSTSGLVPPIAAVPAQDFEPNNDPALATLIALSATISGTLAAGGDTDFFAIEALEQGELALTIASNTPTGNLGLGVYPAAGGNWLPDQTPDGDGQLVVDLPGPGRFIIRIQDGERHDADAAYQVVSTFKPSPDGHEPNATDSHATPTPPNGTLVGAILPGGDSDFFLLDIPAPGEWTIDTRALPDGFEMALGVYPAGGGNWLPDRSPDGDGKLVVDLATPGKYLLRVTEANGRRSADPYVLALGFVAADDAGEPNNAPPIATPVAGTASVVGTILGSGDEDFMIFDAPAQGEWTIAIAEAPAPLEIGLGVYPAPGGNWLPDRSPDGDDRLVVDLPAPGKYLLRVNELSGQRSVDPYRLELGFVASPELSEPNDTPAIAFVIPPDGTLTGTILPAGDYDHFVVTVPDAGEWTIRAVTQPSGINLAFGVYPALGGNWLPDRSPNGDDQLVVDLPAPGRYLLRIADEHGNRSVGAYEVETSFLPTGDAHEPNNAAPTAGTIAASGTLTGTILPQGDQDFFIFEAPQGGQWSITIDSQPQNFGLGLGVYPAKGGNWLPDQTPKGDDRLVVDLPEPGRYILRIDDTNGNRSPQSYTVTTALQ